MAEGRSAGDAFEEECYIIEEDEPEATGAGTGGHAGGGVSEEELRRSGKHYIVTKSGVTYHGKEWHPEQTPRGGMHISIMPGGGVRVNVGEPTPLTQRHIASLQRELKRR